MQLDSSTVLPAGRLHQIADGFVKRTFVLSAEAVERYSSTGIPAYGLAIVVILGTVLVFLLCWCIAYGMCMCWAVREATRAAQAGPPLLTEAVDSRTIEACWWHAKSRDTALSHISARRRWLKGLRDVTPTTHTSRPHPSFHCSEHRRAMYVHIRITRNRLLSARNFRTSISTFVYACPRHTKLKYKLKLQTLHATTPVNARLRLKREGGEA